MMLAPLKVPGMKEEFSSQALALEHYTAAMWANKTYEVVFACAGMERFIPWPDTGRGWAKHLDADKLRWLDQFLPLAGKPPGRIVEINEDTKHKIAA